MDPLATKFNIQKNQLFDLKHLNKTFIKFIK